MLRRNNDVSRNDVITDHELVADGIICVAIGRRLKSNFREILTLTFNSCVKHTFKKSLS